MILTANFISRDTIRNVKQKLAARPEESTRELLDRLADSGAKLVVMDTFFSVPRDPAADAALVAALRRQRGVVLMAEQAGVVNSRLAGVEPTLPDELFLNAAQTNWGVAWHGCRRHRSYCAEVIGRFHRRDRITVCRGPQPLLAGANLNEDESSRAVVAAIVRRARGHGLVIWLALKELAGSFSNKMVFIG